MSQPAQEYNGPRVRSDYADDPDMVELVEYFVQEAKGRADELARLLDLGSMELLGSLAHQMKGAGGGYGFPALSAAAAALELGLRDNAPEAKVREACEALQDICRRVSV